MNESLQLSSSRRRTHLVLVAAMTGLGLVAGSASAATSAALGFPLDANFMASPGAPAPSIPLGTTTGTLVVDANKIPLKHVYATRSVLPVIDAPEWSLEQRTRVSLVFSDVELPAEIYQDDDALTPASLAGKFRGASFVIHRGIAEGSSIKILHPMREGIGAQVIAARDMQSAGGDLILTGLRVDADTLSGVLEMTQPYDLSSNPFFQPGTPATLQLTRAPFHARLDTLPPPVELDGAAAAKTAPFEAFARFNELVRKGDIEKARSLLTEEMDGMMAPMLTTASPEEIQSQFYTGETLHKAISGSVTAGKGATLAFRAGALLPDQAERVGELMVKFKLTQVGGQWKLSGMQ